MRKPRKETPQLLHTLADIAAGRGGLRTVFPKAGLSEREEIVIGERLRGMSYRAIGEALGVSSETARNVFLGGSDRLLSSVAPCQDEQGNLK